MSPEVLLKEKSADITRYWAGTGSLGRDIVFTDEEFKNGSKLVNKIWNASRFVLSLLDGYTPREIWLASKKSLMAMIKQNQEVNQIKITSEIKRK